MNRYTALTCFAAAVLLSGCAASNGGVPPELTENGKYVKYAPTQTSEMEELPSAPTVALQCFADARPVDIEGFFVPEMTLHMEPGKDLQGFGGRADVTSGPPVPQRYDILFKPLVQETKMFTILEFNDVSGRVSAVRLSGGKDSQHLDMANFNLHMDTTFLQWNGGRATEVSLANFMSKNDFMALEVTMTVRLEYQYPTRNVVLLASTYTQRMGKLMETFDWTGVVLNKDFGWFNDTRAYENFHNQAMLQIGKHMVAKVAGYIAGEDCYSGQDVNQGSTMTFKSFVKKLQLEREIAVDEMRLAEQENLQQKLVQVERSIKQKSDKIAFLRSLLLLKNKDLLINFLANQSQDYPTAEYIKHKEEALSAERILLRNQKNQLLTRLKKSDPNIDDQIRRKDQRIRTIEVVGDVPFRTFFVKKDFAEGPLDPSKNYVEELEELSFRGKLKHPGM